MSETPIQTPRGNAIVERAKAILLTPREEWPRIEAELSTIGQIYRGYVIPLAAIPALATLIGALLFGYSVLGITYRPSIASALSTAVVQYALALGGVYVLALVIDFLAPKFDATPNRVQAFKVAAYAMTAGWLAGVFGILPALAWLSILGLYSLYLLYLGLPLLMKAPADKAMSYTAVVVLVGIVIGIVIAAVAAPVARLFSPGLPSIAMNDGSVSGTLDVPGVGSLDMGKLDAAAKQAQQVVTPNGNPRPALAPDVLQAMLPGTLAGLARTEISSSSAGAAGIGGSTAEAKYGDGDARVTLRIIDMAAMGGLAPLGTAFNVQSNRETATGYERTQTIDGRMTSEKWDTESKRGSFGVLVGNRFMIEADGSGIESIDALKAAVTGIDFGNLERATS